MNPTTLDSLQSKIDEYNRGRELEARINGIVLNPDSDVESVGLALEGDNLTGMQDGSPHLWEYPIDRDHEADLNVIYGTTQTGKRIALLRITPV